MILRKLGVSVDSIRKSSVWYIYPVPSDISWGEKKSAPAQVIQEVTEHIACSLEVPINPVNPFVCEI
jgi:hypothetical protein